MADVQLENGYTKIANIILEALARQPLNGTQRRILDVVFRYTYGFNRKEHELSLTFISAATMCDKRQLQRELKELEIKKIIFQSIGAKRIISFNKNYEQWIGESTIGKKDIGEITNGETPNTSIGESTNADIGKSTNQEINYLNKTLKKDIVPFSDIQDLFNTICVSLSKVQKMTNSRKDKISVRWKEMPDIAEWKRLFEIIECTPFLKGQNDRGWKVSFDWLIKNDTNMVGVLEGKYSNQVGHQNKAKGTVILE